MKRNLTYLAIAAAVSATPVLATDGASHPSTDTLIAPGLVLPNMNAERGRALFASKGCVVCHSVNGVGGEDAPMLDYDTMDTVMNPFDFAARMWRGAEPMVMMQQDELGAQIELTGQDLADIVAFMHDAEEQKKFSEEDIPEEIEDLMHRQSEDEGHEEGDDADHG